MSETTQTNEAKGLHLWFNGYDHSIGATEDEARRWLSAECGMPVEECDGEGWVEVPDGEVMLDEDGKPERNEDGTLTGETALDVARVMLARRPIPEY
jgi:hypothetical protein